MARDRRWPAFVARRLLVGALVATVLAGCAVDLGPCTGDAETQARGWLALQQSCSGSTCHATSATGRRRNGAPSGLDWDDPDVVRDHADEIWSDVESGFMPPESWIERVQDAELDDGERAAVRQFLACGARTVVAP